MANGIGFAAFSAALVSLPAMAAAIDNTAVDQTLDAHSVRAALHIGYGADSHGRGDTGKVRHPNRAGPIRSDIRRIALGPCIAVDAVHDRRLGERCRGAAGHSLALAGGIFCAELPID